MATNNNRSTTELPVWDYGTRERTNSINLPQSGPSSGLMLQEHEAANTVVQPEVAQIQMYPLSENLKVKICEYREQINKLVNTVTVHDDDPKGNKPKPKSFHKLLIITGPEYFKSPFQTKVCSRWIAKVSGHRQYTFEDVVFGEEDNPQHLLMDVFANAKERTDRKVSQYVLMAMRSNLTHVETGPGPDEVRSSVEATKGIPICRTWLHEIAKNCPVAISLSNTIMPQYIADLCCLGLCDPSYLESQLHRELVSGCSYPCGFESHTLCPRQVLFLKLEPLVMMIPLLLLQLNNWLMRN
ncbi:unnamed protein product [Ambrosiozyma monospora]|uniref:Unnamed protein product n=1 Tax=Ambrosiozyma monospora TaxID=43982 RepID=A0ACB5SUI2_AMBMO|nr:unnamed protein product [Ambrosiozyma monospora]